MQQDRDTFDYFMDNETRYYTVYTSQITNKFGMLVRNWDSAPNNVSVVISNKFMLPDASQPNTQSFSSINKNTPLADFLYGSEVLYIKVTSAVA